MAKLKLYTASVNRPRFESWIDTYRHSLPRDWKNLGILEEEVRRNKYGKEKKTIEFDNTTITLSATSKKEAKEKIEYALRKSYGKFIDEAIRKGEFWNKKNSKAGDVKLFKKNYIKIEDSKNPLYAMSGFDFLGMVLSFKEIKDLIENNTLPRIFIEFPNLIPKQVFIPSKKEDEQQCIYNGENLTKKIKTNIAKCFVAYEEKGRGYRSIKENLFNSQTFELFPEDVCFWTYYPNTYDPSDGIGYLDDPNNRFAPHTLAPLFWRHEKEIKIGTKEEILGYIKKLTENKKRAYQRSIKSLGNKLEERLTEVNNFI